MKVLMTLVLVFVLAGCAAGKGGAGSTTTQEETTAYKEETTVLEAEGNPRPPDSTLSYGGREVKGQLGSYCWTSGRTGLCAEAPFSFPPRKKTLTVPSGSEMVFRYGGQSSPRTVAATACPFNKKGQVLFRSHRSLKAHGSGVERTIPVELPQGEYGVSVGVTEPQGDASYFFRVMVE